MPKILSFFIIALLLESCQKPDLAPSVTVGQKTNCVGGGCSHAARTQIDMEIRADGTWISSKEELKQRNPLEDRNDTAGTSLWGDFYKGIADFWDPGSVVEKPLLTSAPLPTEPSPSEEADTVAGGQTNAPSPTFDENDQDSETPSEDSSDGLRGSELDKMANNIGRHLTAGFGELSGKNKKKRKEARETKRKIAEATALKDKVETMVNDMNTGSETIQNVVQDVLDPTKFTPTGDLKGITKDLATEHNVSSNSMVDDTVDIDSEVEVPAEKLAYNTPELRSVENARNYQSYVQRKIDGMSGPDKAQRQELVNFAGNSLAVAEASFRAGDSAKGEMARNLAIAGLDLALSLTPGVGLAKDIYEFSAGVNALTGAKLTTFERTMAAVGILTVGYGSKLAILGKAGALVDIVRAGSKDADAVAAATKAASKAEEVVLAAEKIGVKEKSVIEEIADAVKGGLPCKIVQLTPFEKLLNFLEPVAYAADCIPGSVENVLTDTLDSAKKWKMNAESLTGVKDIPVDDASSVMAKFRQGTDAIVNYVGSEARFVRNSSDDVVIISKDGTRRVRFDLKRPYPHNNPHTHVEELIGGKWEKSGPIYPLDVPPN